MVAPVALRRQAFQARAAMPARAAQVATAVVVSPPSLTPAEQVRGLQVPAAMVAPVEPRPRVRPVMAVAALQQALQVLGVHHSAVQWSAARAATAQRVAPEAQVRQLA